MAKRKNIFDRLTALVLCFAIVFGMLPLEVFAATSLEIKAGDKVSDNSTINGWQTYFGTDEGNISTQFAGAIWTDKSVYADGNAAKNDLPALEDEIVAQGDNFLVALSALSATKEIHGFSYIPTDTVLVLDLSNSMEDNDLQQMTNAANAAIKKLYATSNYNRVGIATYNGHINTLLPIDRYSRSNDANNPYLTCTITKNNWGQTTKRTISVSTGVKNSRGGNVSMSVEGQSGTYTQAGIYRGYQLFENIQDTSIETGNIQGGTKRIPVMVLMTDGDPTYGSVNYLQPTRETMSNSSSSYTTNSEVVFLTQLTAAYTRAFMEDHYGRTPLFYTLGLGVEGNHAPQVLNPKLSESLVAQSVNSFWDSYKNSAKNGQISGLLVKTDWRGNEYTENGNCTYGGADVKKLDDVLRADRIYANRQYVDKYFPANDAQAMVDAFDSIVQEIIMQSQYYPTLVSSGKYDMDGYVSMVDELGEFMEVKDVHGMMLGDTLFSGKAFVEAANNGVYGNASTWTETGWELVYSISERLKFPTTRQSNCCAVHSTKARLVKTAAITPT